MAKKISRLDDSASVTRSAARVLNSSAAASANAATTNPGRRCLRAVIDARPALHQLATREDTAVPPALPEHGLRPAAFTPNSTGCPAAKEEA